MVILMFHFYVLLVSERRKPTLKQLIGKGAPKHWFNYIHMFLYSDMNGTHYKVPQNLKYTLTYHLERSASFQRQFYSEIIHMRKIKGINIFVMNPSGYVQIHDSSGMKHYHRTVMEEKICISFGQTLEVEYLHFRV